MTTSNWPGDETDEQILAALKSTCGWTLRDRQGGYYVPACAPNALVLKHFAARFCSFCGKPLEVIDGY